MDIQIQIFIHPDLCQHYSDYMKEDVSRLRVDLEEAPRPGDSIDLSYLGKHLVSEKHGYLFKPILDVAGGNLQEMTVKIDQALWTPDKPWLMEAIDREPTWQYLGDKEEILDIWTMAGTAPLRNPQR